MTYADLGAFANSPLEPGRASAAIDRFFRLMGRAGAAYNLEDEEGQSQSIKSPLEERLSIIQDAISGVSMHLPSGFAHGLNRQFANLMDDDAWEEADELISLEAFDAFLALLIHSRTKRRPGIGTNGSGSVVASWVVGPNRLIADCLPSGLVSVVLTRLAENGQPERAAIGPINPRRLRKVLEPFHPEVWFDE